MVTPEEKLLQKHPALTDEQIKQKFKEADRAKEKYQESITQLEENLFSFRDIKDPIIDPNTDKILAWMKRPTNMQVKEYLSKFRKKQDISKMSQEEVDKIENEQYEMIAEFIIEPKHEIGRAHV